MLYSVAMDANKISDKDGRLTEEFLDWIAEHVGARSVDWRFYDIDNDREDVKAIFLMHDADAAALAKMTWS